MGRHRQNSSFSDLSVVRRVETLTFLLNSELVDPAKRRHGLNGEDLRQKREVRLIQDEEKPCHFLSFPYGLILLQDRIRPFKVSSANSHSFHRAESLL